MAYREVGRRHCPRTDHYGYDRYGHCHFLVRRNLLLRNSDAGVRVIVSPGFLFGKSSPRTLYVSKSTGNDANDGSEATPWQTIAKLNATRFYPGDTIRLKKGDTWTGEEFLPLGNGLYNASAFASAFTSTLATQTALYTIDGTRAAYKAILVSNGMTSSAADPVADAYIGYLARADAIQAGHIAADPVSSWITLTSYGTGARPLIQPGGTIPAAIRWNTHPFTGGWKIRDINIDSAYISGIVYDLGAGVTPAAAGLWLEDIHITNCTGQPVKITGFPYPGLIAPYQPFCSTGIDVAHVSHIRMNNIEVDHCDQPIFLWGSQWAWISGNYWHHAYIEGSIVTGFSPVGYVSPGIFPGTADSCLIETTEISFTAYAASPSGQGPGFPKGETNFQLAHNTNLIIRVVNSHNCVFRHSDATGIDYEGHSPGFNTPTFMIKDCIVSHNGGPAFLEDDTVSDLATLVIIDNNVLADNSNTNFVNPIMFGGRTIGDPWYFTRNNLARGNALQKVFGGDATNPYVPKYDAPPVGKLFGPSNVVHFP